MIDRLRVQNFRCLRDVEVPLGPLNFLVGPNNSGKSSFVDAVRVLSRCVNARSAAEVFARRNEGVALEGERKLQFEHVLSKGGREPCLGYECRFTWARGDGTDGKGRLVADLGQAPESRQGADHVRFRKELLFLTGPDGREVLRAQASDKEQSILVGGSGGADPQGFPEFRKPVSSTPVYRLVPERISQACSSAVENVRLDGDGYGLASWLDSFAASEPAAFDQIQGILRNLVPGMDRVTFPTLPGGLKTILFHEKWGAKVYATEASDGLLLFLAYLAIAYAHGPMGVILLEEPETGVHPRRLEDIVRLLRGISRGETGLPPVQVIATSHSPYLLDWCGKDEIVLFQREGDGNVRTTPLAAVKDIDEQLKDWSPGDLIYTLGEQICESPS